MLLLFALSSLLSCAAQNVQIRPVREQSEFRSNLIEDNYDYLASLAETNELYSLHDLFDNFKEEKANMLSSECAEDIYLLILAGQGKFEYPEFAKQVWLPLLDSTGRISPAILKGHFHFGGHYSECAQIDAKLTGRDRPFKADYFRADVDLLFRSSAKNGSCSAAWSFGVCLPASCSSAELNNMILGGDVKSNPLCNIHRTNDAIPELDAGFYVTISIMGIIVALCIVSGLADFFLSDYVSDKAISKGLLWRSFMSFSLFANVSSIFDTSGSKKEGQIAPIHCIRFFSMCWVVLGHLSSTIPGLVANPLDIVSLTKDLTTEFILNAFFSVDSFFFVGGLLLTFLWFKNYHRNPKQTNSPGAWVMFYVHRFLRLSPPFFILVLFFAFVFKQLYRNSPVNIALENQNDACRDTWWLEFTYLHNLIDNDNQCVGYTWYLDADFQMFFFSPLIIIPLALKPFIGLIVAAAFFVASSAVNIFLVYHYHWPATPNFMPPTDPEMTGTENYEVYMYYSPVTRCQVYIIGMLVGWFLQTKRRMRIHPIINIALWILCIALMLTLILGLHSQTTGELMPIFWRAMYSAFSKPAWALALSWIIISCYYGYGGPINSFMSWHIWVPLGRLSYCGYLIHFPMIFIILVQSHDDYYFSSFTDFVLTRLIPIIALIYFVAIFWSACFEISFSKLEMVLLGGYRKEVTTEKALMSQRKRSKSDAEHPEEQSDLKTQL